ncbi:MAG: hypothetical protein CBB97_08065 [Candidatus Endolissoclinum sp. TMED37]|nr:MAG: hypothetical protein CBB97_08065 [Candidatus Endolissoclinum sp. TMED37]
MINTVIISATSDIGLAYARHCKPQTTHLLGTYRDLSRHHELNGICDTSLYLDLSHGESIESFKIKFNQLALKWSRLIFCPCQPYPYQDFFKSKFSDWEESFHINSIKQLELLHFLYRSRDKDAKVLFFAGGGTNSAVEAFSAYTSAKIHLIKMVELLDHENNDMCFSILGPGWVNTKTHLNVLNHSDPNSQKYKETIKFIKKPLGATPIDEVVHSINWIFNQPKKIVGGRNFSTAYDPINMSHSDSERLTMHLEKDTNMYKLRRHGNHIFNVKRFAEL